MMKEFFKQILKLFNNKERDFMSTNIPTNTNIPYIPFDKIESITSLIREKTGFNDTLIVDVSEIAKQLGFEVYEDDFNGNDDISGKVIIDSDSKKFEIYVNKKESEERKRFTIAHELGHVFLHASSKGTYQDTFYRGQCYDEFDRLEYQANLFASSLLMPKDTVKKLWNDFKKIEPISKFFVVSEDAAKIRLKNLELL